MSFRTISLGLLAALALGCGGDPPRSDDPQTAKEKQRREAAAAGETSSGSKWGGWRYTGDRDECYFVVGRKCFKTEKAACQAARCKAPKRCNAIGGGPATMQCK